MDPQPRLIFGTLPAWNDYALEQFLMANGLEYDEYDYAGNFDAVNHQLLYNINTMIPENLLGLVEGTNPVNMVEPTAVQLSRLIKNNNVAFQPVLTINQNIVTFNMQNYVMK